MAREKKGRRIGPVGLALIAVGVLLLIGLVAGLLMPATYDVQVTPGSSGHSASQEAWKGSSGHSASQEAWRDSQSGPPPTPVSQPIGVEQTINAGQGDVFAVTVVSYAANAVPPKDKYPDDEVKIAPQGRLDKVVFRVRNVGQRMTGFDSATNPVLIDEQQRNYSKDIPTSVIAMSNDSWGLNPGQTELVTLFYDVPHGTRIIGVGVIGYRNGEIVTWRV